MCLKKAHALLQWKSKRGEWDLSKWIDIGPLELASYYNICVRNVSLVTKLSFNYVSVKLGYCN